MDSANNIQRRSRSTELSTLSKKHLKKIKYARVYFWALKKHSTRYYFIKSKNVSLIITIGYLRLTLRTVTSKSKQGAISPISMPYDRRSYILCTPRIFQLLKIHLLPLTPMIPPYSQQARIHSQLLINCKNDLTPFKTGFID